jgi:ribosomal protein S18 acetylase RimI-like enzyme
MSVTPIHPADLSDVARLIAKQNANPETQCLYSGERAEEIEAALRKQTAPCYVVAREGRTLIGAMGCEVEEERGYLQGPFVDGADFDAVADALWSALQMQIASLTGWEAFLHVRNERGAAFYLRQGFRRGQTAQIYVLPASALQPIEGEPARRFTPECAAGVRALHELAFADSPDSIEPFMNGDDETRCLFVYVDKGRCVGYVAASVNDNPREGSIDLLAVDASVRNRGYGRRLLLTAAHWLIRERGMPQVGLTVRDMRADARGLYQRSGFRLLHTGVGYAREFPTNKRR